MPCAGHNGVTTVYLLEFLCVAPSSGPATKQLLLQTGAPLGPLPQWSEAAAYFPDKTRRDRTRGPSWCRADPRPDRLPPPQTQRAKLLPQVLRGGLSPCGRHGPRGFGCGGHCPHLTGGGLRLRGPSPCRALQKGHPRAEGRVGRGRSALMGPSGEHPLERSGANHGLGCVRESFQHLTQETSRLSSPGASSRRERGSRNAHAAPAGPSTNSGHRHLDCDSLPLALSSQGDLFTQSRAAVPQSSALPQPSIFQSCSNRKWILNHATSPSPSRVIFSRTDGSARQPAGTRRAPGNTRDPGLFPSSPPPPPGRP